MWSHTCPTSSASCQNTRGRTRSHSSQPPMAAASAADRMFLIYTEINTHISHNCSNILTIHGAQLHSAVSFTLTLHLKLEYWNIHIFCEISITKLPLHFDSLGKKRFKVQNEPRCFDLIALAFIFADTRNHPNMAAASWLKQGCHCEWELHPCNITGLCAVSYSLFILTFLSPLSSHSCLCRVLLRTSYCLVLTVWFSPTRYYFCVLLKSPAASTALKPAPPLVFVVVLHRCCIFIWFHFDFWGDCFSFSSFRQLCCLLDCQTPRACRALSLARTVTSSVIG